MERRSLIEYLAHFLQKGRQTAYVQRRGYRTVRWSYRQVAEIAFQLARELELRGIGKGERVTIWGSNSAEWVAAFLGCALRGVVVVPMDDVATPDFALRVHQQVGAKLLVCSREHEQATLETLTLDDLPDALASHSPAACLTVDVDPTDTLEIVFTSGTTAEPKGVVITHGNVLANIAPLEMEIRKYLKYERLGASCPLLESVAAQPCLRAISGNLSAATDGRNGDIPGGIEAVRDHRARFVASVFQSWWLCHACCSRSKRRSSAISDDEGCREQFRQQLRTCRRQTISAPLVDLPPHPSPVRMEVLGLHLRRSRPRPQTPKNSGDASDTP